MVRIALASWNSEIRSPVICFLGGRHLDRRRGNVRAQLGEPDAVEQFTAVLAASPDHFIRTRAAAHVDLAFVHVGAGTRDTA
jgi:hypothetical protein